MKSVSTLTLLIAFSLFPVASQAALVADYVSAASGSNATLAPNLEDTAVTATDFTAGSGLTSGTGGTYNWSAWDTASTSFAAAVAANDMFSWGFTVNANSSVDLESLDIRLDRSGTGPDDFEIQASVNGGSATSLLTYDFADTDSGVNFIGVDLSSIVLLVPRERVDLA